VLNLSKHRIFQNFRIKLLNLEQRVDELEQRAREILRHQKTLLAESRATAALFEEKMANRVKRLLRDLLSKWEKLSVELHNISPLDILKKGYTLCWKDDLQLIRRIEEVDGNKDITVSFYKGEFTCRVKSLDRDILLESRLTKEKK